MNPHTIAGLLEHCSKEEVQKYLNEILALTKFQTTLVERNTRDASSQLTLEFEHESMH